MNAEDDLKPWPAAAEGYQRFVFRLPAREDELNYKIELIVGKTEQLDKINRYFYGGKLVRENIEGWGYHSYKLVELGPLAGTRMAVPPDAPRVDRFITVNHDLGLIHYNSKLPVVVYVPNGCEVKFRVWTGGDIQTVETES